MGLTPEELALLTDEEREGLEDEDDETDDDAGGDDAGGDDDQGGDEDDGAGEDDGKGKDGGNDDDQPGRDDGATDDEEQDAPRAQLVPLIRGEAPADAEEKLKAIDTREDELSQKFEDGDITTTEYRTGLRELNRERDDINWSLRKAELSRETTQAQAEATWYSNVEAFLSEHPEIRKNQLVYNAFDAVVRDITSNKENHGLSDRKQLEKAYQVWAESLGYTPEPKKDDAKGKGATKEAKKGQREIPPNLARVPAAEANDTDDGKYAHLDRLMETDPIKFEAALAKLSDSDRDAYLASA